MHPDNRRRPIAGTRELSALTTRLLVHSGFAESAGKAVEDRLHHVLEKRTLSGLDVNVGGHPGRRDEFRHVPENIVLVQAHPNYVEFRCSDCPRCRCCAGELAHGARHTVVTPLPIQLGQS